VLAVGQYSLWILPEGKPSLHSTLAASLFLAALSFGVGSFWLVLAYRKTRAGLRLAGDGIIIRGPLRTWHLNLADAETFKPGLWGFGTPCPLLHVRSGKTVGIWSLGGPGWSWRYATTLRELEPLCDDLNELLTTLRERPAA
jgi:hypothetical protein